MSVKKPALGRGIEALFNPAPEPQLVPVVARSSVSNQIPIELIVPNPFQPRKSFDPEKLADLASSIREKGILQPLLLRPTSDGRYQIIAGERRWRAAQQAGLHVVPAVLKEYDDQEMTEAAIIENIQRDDLNAVEEARAYATLSNQFGLTQDAISQAVGKSRTAIANSIRLLKLPEEVLDLIRKGALNAGQARPLIAIPTIDEQISMAESIIHRGLSAREVEQWVQDYLADQPKAVPSGSEVSSANSIGTLSDWEERLMLKLGLKVRIVPKTNKSGKIEVIYSSLDEFQKFCEELGVPPSQV